MDNENGSENNNSEIIEQEVSQPDYPAYYADIVNAILLIPATLIVLAFFSCLYKIFINRRLRG